MTEPGDWTGSVRGRGDDAPGRVTMVRPLTQARRSWSRPFEAEADDGRRYFVKSLDTCPRNARASVAVEYLVARVGALIRAPIPETRLLRVPEGFAGWSPFPGRALTCGFAHAIVALPDCADIREYPAEADAENLRRLVAVHALYDWCWGRDPQWVYSGHEQPRLYTVDHGLYLEHFRRVGSRGSTFVPDANRAHELRRPESVELPGAAVEEVSSLLRAVSRTQLVEILNSVPASWPVGDTTLENLGWFLEHRAPQVAHRLEHSAQLAQPAQPAQAGRRDEPSATWAWKGQTHERHVARRAEG